MTDTVRCFDCGMFCGNDYGTEFFQIDAEVYCSLNCYKELRLKEENERSERPVTRKSTKRQSATGRSKRAIKRK